MKKDYELIVVNQKDRVALVTLRRPEAMNALNTPIIGELTDAVINLDRNPSIGAVVLTGNEKTFSVGGDIKEMGALEGQDARDYLTKGQILVGLIERSRLPWIAAVNGYCIGGGVELALGCDIIYSDASARFRMPEARLGIIPGFGGTQRLPKRIGAGKAREMIYTGREILAQEAYSIGLVDRIVDGDLISKTYKIAAQIASGSPAAIAEAKRVISLGQEDTTEQGFRHELDSCAALFDSDYKKQVMSNFGKK